MMYLSGLFGGGLMLIEAALLICMFWVSATRPERIRAAGQFRAAGIILALAIVVPVIFLFAPGSLGGSSSASGESDVYKYVFALQWVFLAMSIVMSLDAVGQRE